MDPFSIASGVAGLISLGLTVSDGLIQYCKDYRSQDQDLSQLAQHAQELKSVLTLVENRTTQLQSPDGDITTSFEGCRDACKACLRDFERLDDKYADLKSGQTSKGHSRKLLRNLKYPFDKRKFEDVRSQFQEFNTRVLGHLQLVNFDLTRDMRIQITSESARLATAIEEVGKQFQTSLSNTELSVKSTMHHDIDRLEVSIGRGLQKTESNMASSVAVGLRDLSDSFGDKQEQQTSIIIHRLDQVLQIFQTQNLMRTTSPAIDDRMALAKPSMQNYFPDGHASRTLASGASLRSLCDCPRTRDRHSTMQHRNDCLYSFSNRKKRSFTIKLAAFRRELIATFQIEYSPSAWARNWRIQPNLTLRATVQRDAPAFEAISKVERTVSRVATTQEIEETFQNCLIELRQIFTSGKGWPTDVDKDGRNLLHSAMTYYSMDYSSNGNCAVLQMQFITALVHMGVPINDISIYDGTPLYNYLSNLVWNHFSTARAYIVNQLVDMGAVSVNGSKLFFMTIAILSLNITDLYEPLADTNLFHEVLFRSESSMVHLLHQDRTLLCARNVDGNTLLHMAANWPKGLSVLIEVAGEDIRSIVNTRDTFGYSPLDYAMTLAEPDSVRILLAAGSCCTDPFYYLSYVGSTARKEEIICILIETIAIRRRNLLGLALRNLSPEIIEKLGIGEDLLDYKAYDVAEALRQQIPLCAMYDDLKIGSVYQLAPSTIDREVGGYTPLMILDSDHQGLAGYLEMVSWFEDHGADLYTPIPVKKRRSVTPDKEKIAPIHLTMHKISFELGRLRTDFWRVSPELPTKQLFQFSKLLRSESRDPCLCYCTTDGCTSASVFARSFRYHDSYPSKHKQNVIFGKIRLVEQAISHCDRHRVALDLIRVSTFEMLGMSHTCCKYWSGSLEISQTFELLSLMDPKKVDRIREEDRRLAKLLETLMEEFRAKLSEMSVPLSKFVEEYWWPRMQEVEKERDELSVSELHAIREIGIVLDES
ncbi:hypothetical protein M434DRAFT_33774 [Hypoxylon sp. CO27-5]|nr:hypothetical protein M434DRAFT_33774 [Hypoxylon sp. CO27-5]